MRISFEKIVHRSESEKGRGSIRFSRPRENRRSIEIVGSMKVVGSIENRSSVIGHNSAPARNSNNGLNSAPGRNSTIASQGSMLFAGLVAALAVITNLVLHSAFADHRPLGLRPPTLNPAGVEALGLDSPTNDRSGSTLVNACTSPRNLNPASISASQSTSPGPAMQGRTSENAAPASTSSASSYASHAISASVPYYGGAVLSQARVVLVYWGSTLDPAIQKQLETFYPSIVNSTYLDQLFEYSTAHLNGVNGHAGSNQTIGRGSYSGSVTIAPIHNSLKLSQADIAAELEAQISNGSLLKPDANTLYMIHFPGGVQISISFGDSCGSWYADHEVDHSEKWGDIYYAMMPCGNDAGSLSSLTLAASHELAEAITDPASPLANVASDYPAAWIQADGQEIGDLCAWQQATLIGPHDSSGSSASFEVQKIWSNAAAACVGAEYH